jgi:serine/threonine protein kinase
MGQTPSTNIDKLPKVEFNPDVEVIQKGFDPHYGEVKIVRDNKTKDKFILKEIVVNTKQAFEAEVSFYNKRVTLSNPNVVGILGYNLKDKQDFCSTYYKISIYIENLETNLQSELEARIANQTPFTENELLLITDDLVNGLSYFQSEGYSHGDIRPFNIFSSGKTYKLSDPSLNAQKGSNALTLAIVQNTKTLLSPQLIEQVPKNRFDITVDRYKADVFSLGVTLLSLAALASSEDLYDYGAGTFNNALLQERVESLRGRYSDFTLELICSMLQAEEENRPDFVALSNKLLPYKDEIRRGTETATEFTFQTKGEGEGVKRSAAVNVDDTVANADRQLADSRTLPNSAAYDDLEARIRAALERSEATFRAVSSSTPYYGTSTYTSAYPGGYTSNYPYTSTYVPATTYTNNAASGEIREVEGTERKASETEKVVKSSAPGTSDEADVLDTKKAVSELARPETEDTKVNTDPTKVGTENVGGYTTGNYTYTSPYAYTYVPTTTYNTYGVTGTGSMSPTRLSAYLNSTTGAGTTGGTSGVVKDIVKDVILNEKVEEIVKSSSPRNLKKSSSPRKGDVTFTSSYIPATTTTYSYTGGAGYTSGLPGTYNFTSSYPYTYTNYGTTGTTGTTGTEGTGVEGSKQYTVTYDVQGTGTGQQNQAETVEGGQNKEVVATNEATSTEVVATTNEEGGFSEQVEKVQS